jgi:hypothetical protein
MRTLPWGVSTSAKVRACTRRSADRCAAQGGGFGEDELRDGFAVLRFGDDAQQVAGRPFFMRRAAARHRARRTPQALGGVGQHLRVEVVDIGFDHADGEGFVGAGGFAQDDAQHVGLIGKS